MTAAALGRALAGQSYSITLVESEAIGTVGVGEATVPPILDFNRYLRIDPDEFLRETNGSIKLGIEFEDWGGAGHRYFHPFGFFGVEMSGIHFHHFWLRHVAEVGPLDHSEYHLEAMALREGRFARMTRTGPVHHAVHFDASLYARFLRGRAEASGVVRVEGKVVHVRLDPENGYIDALALDDGRTIEGDLFIDCSGFRGLLIEGALETGYESWNHWLPCDSAVAVPAANAGDPLPFTRSTAREAGWQWRIPLQHRDGNGYVYSSAHLPHAEAARLLSERLPGPAQADPNFLRFTAGHRRKIWNRNCVAIGLAGGFLEPLESTSIHLIQTTIIRLLALLPRDGIDPNVVARFNRESLHEYRTIRDFVIAHYALAGRDDTPFWRDVAATGVPDTLAERIEAFRATGNILFEPGDLFGPTNWYWVMTGQGVWPRSWHPIADGLSSAELTARLAVLRGRVAEQLAELPPHVEFLRRLSA
ncbi:tryptophan 7-halogenase [Sphingomonas koreensis]|nr:tryptophan 7-halogenase [Sphingomonas koreensis]RSU26896.1 tryptophan 7-halogenase [Sphingomonas koreensis]RSU30934.1 tryptophan 7-halogenase [Sphingomonas koreensis]RSU37040.1 tryptophan 7-halogenase [Sphingomonas koreensis]RSU39523.1 tryptophan 7-halogenase [Sphingomonas koreensis]